MRELHPGLLHPGLLAHQAARTRDLPALAAALAHGAEVNWADAADEGKTPLVQAVLGVSTGRAYMKNKTAYLRVRFIVLDRDQDCSCLGVLMAGGQGS